MPKNIIVCCDGTGNQYGVTNTNVVKLVQALDFNGPTRQIAFYDPGVGTGNPRGAITHTRRALSRAGGLAFGTGLFRNVSDGYRFLMSNYASGDRVYIFGFSRGAYTARALTGMLHMLGLIRPGGENLVPYALELFRKRMPSNQKKRSEYFKVARGFKKTYSTVCKPHFLGVWDTVKTVGIWDALKVMSRWQTALPYTYSVPDVQFGRHAISIDERRSRFRPNMWERRTDNTIQQVWFPGVHCDVGGGYEASGLSDAALIWMLKGAETHGLLLRDDVYSRLQPDPGQEPNESLTWQWRPLGWKRRHVRGPGSWIESSRNWEECAPSVHICAQERMSRRSDYRPKLPDSTRYVDDDWDSYSEA